MSTASTHTAAPAGIWSRLRAWPGIWAATAVTVALLPVLGMFSTSRIFAVRDLAIYFWPKHRWLRDTILSGQWPWWDPYMGSGQSAAADAMLQMFFAPTLLLRLVLPEVLGFNLWVGLPFPLAALGTYLFARRHLSRQASALAAIVFAVCGPVVSTGNAPNLSWSAAGVPWVMWAVARCVRQPGGRAFVVLACCAAAQILSGEPITMTATMVLATVYTIVRVREEGLGNRAASARLLVVWAGMAAGAAVSAVQLLPLYHAASHSLRTATGPEYGWSLHPAAVVETLAPYLFGDNFEWGFSPFPWMRALGSGREPFFYSLYCGVPVFALALLGMFAARRRWAAFWSATAVCALLLAFGNHTLVFPEVQHAIPLMRSFRYPPKYLVMALLAVAMLAGYGWHALTEASRRSEPLAWRVKAPAVGLAILLATVGYAATTMALLFRETLLAIIFRVALFIDVPDMAQAVSTMLAMAEPHGRRLLLLAAGTAFLLWVAAAGRRESRFACAALFAAVCGDLVVTNARINVMMPMTFFERPEWVRVAQQHPSEPFYFGGRLHGWMDEHDIDTPEMGVLPAWANAMDKRTIMQGRIAMIPSQWKLREALSLDLPVLFPFDYARLIARFEGAPRAERLRFLTNVGVRDCVLPVPPRPDAAPLADVPGFRQMRMYECNPSASRARVTPPWGWVEPNVQKQIDLLFRPEFDGRSMVLLGADPPPPSGVPGAPAATPFARFTRDDTNEVELIAGVGVQGGFLVLNDTYDDDWHVEVDGQPAPLLRANALYRAVRLVAGEHRVRFQYRPRPVLYGAWLSAGASLGLLATAFWGRGKRAISSVEVPLSVASTPSL